MYFTKTQWLSSSSTNSDCDSLTVHNCCRGKSQKRMPNGLYPFRACGSFNVQTSTLQSTHTLVAF